MHGRLHFYSISFRLSFFLFCSTDDENKLEIRNFVLLNFLQFVLFLFSPIFWVATCFCHSFLLYHLFACFYSFSLLIHVVEPNLFQFMKMNYSKLNSFFFCSASISYSFHIHVYIFISLSIYAKCLKHNNLYLYVILYSLYMNIHTHILDIDINVCLFLQITTVKNQEKEHVEMITGMKVVVCIMYTQISLICGKVNSLSLMR